MSAALEAILVLSVLAGAPPGAPAPAPTGAPPGLACLPKWYSVAVVQKDGVWSLQLPDGRVFPYDDRQPKTLDQMLEAPDMQDTYVIPYRSGAIVPVLDENDEPGHIRFEPLFQATYGERAREVDLVRVWFVGTGLRVHRKVKPAFERVAARLQKALVTNPRLKRYLEDLGGTFIWRNIADTERRSMHSYGIAIDLNPRHSHYWDWIRPKRPVHWRNSIPQAIVDAFEAEGFIWGGRWFHYDTMHFEYRPEFFDPACAGRP